jgi:hypothetical protein
VEIYAVPASTPSSLPEAEILERGRSRSVLLQPVTAGVFRAAFVPEAPPATIRIETRVDFGKHTSRKSTELALGMLESGAVVWFSGDSYTVRLEAPEAYSSRSLITFSEGPGKTRRGFESVAGRIGLAPLDVFFNEKIAVLVVARSGSLSTSHGVFAEHDDWVSFLGRFDEKGRCDFTVRHPYEFVVLEDRQGPEIYAVEAVTRRPFDGKVTFSSRITDRGSGVDAGSLKAYVDNEVAIVSIDPDTGVITGRTTKPLPYGEHRFRLEARDRMGNAAGREFTVDLSR